LCLRRRRPALSSLFHLGLLGGEEQAGPGRRDGRDDPLAAVDEAATICELVRVREDVVDGQQPKRSKRAEKVGLVVDIVRALGVQEDQIPAAADRWGDVKSVEAVRPGCDEPARLFGVLGQEDDANRIGEQPAVALRTRSAGNGFEPKMSA
jgi:hypothetical protein